MQNIYKPAIWFNGITRFPHLHTHTLSANDGICETYQNVWHVSTVIVFLNCRNTADSGIGDSFPDGRLDKVLCLDPSLRHDDDTGQLLFLAVGLAIVHFTVGVPFICIFFFLLFPLH